MLSDRLGAGIALQHAEKHGLEHIFGVVGVAGDAVGGAEHHGVVLAEDLFQIRRRSRLAGSMGAAISAFILSGSS